MDIGAWTGVLSIFAARAGAKHVYAIECSDTVTMTKAIIKENNLHNKITVIYKKVNNLTLGIEIPPKGVDIIISEWMGFCLFY